MEQRVCPTSRRETDFWNAEAEVIGNIFDNRDLLPLLLACPNTRETLEELKKPLGLAEQEPETPSYG